jgi:outer membrane protein assembly factor BamE (lipoprotein component of BamABCDE complex)
MKRIILLAAIGLFSACSPIQAQRGQFVTDIEYNAIKTGVTTMPELLATLGTPTSRPAFDDNVWIYIGEFTEEIGINTPKTTGRRVVRITFDENGIVSQKTELDENANKKIAMTPGATKVVSKEPNIIQQLFGNIGRFSKTK